MSINKIIAYSRARDARQDCDSILKFVGSRLIATLGPCGKSVPNEQNTTRFYFDTFRGISIPITPYPQGLTNEDKNSFVLNDEDKDSNIALKFFQLGGAYFKIEETTSNTTFYDDFFFIVKELLSLCGGGVIRYEDTTTNDCFIEVIGGYKTLDEDKKNAIELTTKMLNSGVFEDNEKASATSLGFDGCPLGYFPGLANGFLSNRCVVVEELNKNIYTVLKELSSYVNISYLKLYPNPYQRATHMGDRLNAITFVQYLVQVRNMLDIDSSNLLELYKKEQEPFSNWLMELGYDKIKNTKGIIEMFWK